MKTLWRWSCLCLLIFPTRLLAQQKQATPTPQATASPEAKDSKDSKGESEENQPFQPYWDNELMLSSSSQQAGQSTDTLTYTRTRHFNERGSFLSATLEAGRQKLEGAGSNFGSLSVNGGLGIGIFTPSLSIGIEGGDSALRQINGGLSLAFQFGDLFSTTLAVGANAGNHQGDLSAFYPNLTGLVQIDTSSINSSLAVAFVPWEWWTLSLTLEGEYDDTYRLQDIKFPNIKVPVNQTDKIASLILGLDFTLFKNFVLDLSPEVGQEYFPAGAVYSPLSGGLVVSSTAYTQNFAAGTLSLSFNFR